MIILLSLCRVRFDGLNVNCKLFLFSWVLNQYFSASNFLASCCWLVGLRKDNRALLKVILFWWAINLCLAILCISCYFFENKQELLETTLFLLIVTGACIFVVSLENEWVKTNDFIIYKFPFLQFIGYVRISLPSCATNPKKYQKWSNAQENQKQWTHEVDSASQ